MPTHLTPYSKTALLSHAAAGSRMRNAAPRSGQRLRWLNGGSNNGSSNNNATNGNDPFHGKRNGRNNKALLAMGLGLSCLVLAYIAVVIAVTRLHVSQQAQASSHSSPLAMMNQHAQAQAQAQQLVDQIQRMEDEADQQDEEENKDLSLKSSDNNNKKKRNKNLFRKWNLAHELGHNVQPASVLENNNDNNDKTQIENVARAYRHDPPLEQHRTPHRVLTAHIEKVDFDEWEITPLPQRKHAQAELLQARHYTRLNSCQKLLQQMPVDDSPVDDDPFLPWLHDVFPTHDGQFVQIVAQNKRRCKTGVSRLNQTDILLRMQPQASLFQHVPIRRVNSENATQPRYRLSTHEEADPDGLATRFLCRFKGLNDDNIFETLSVFNFDYDWISYRKRYKGFQKLDGGIKSLHTSQLIFQCPVPPELRNTLKLGTSVQDDWATLFLDLIPIRTPPRYLNPVQFLQPRYKEFQEKNVSKQFDPVKAWGSDHVLPLPSDSGRWENIPICLPSLMQYSGINDTRMVEVEEPAQAARGKRHKRKTKIIQKPKEQHRLVSCLWASAGYTTRGNRFAVNDGQRRLLEWMSYNLVIGFDHFYLYDNSGAFCANSTSTEQDKDFVNLKAIADLFGPDIVTYIPWPSQICNNRPNNVDSPGERSSQYAAESSCRLRFGPHVRWIGQFDVDEYLVPMGKHTTLTPLLDTLEAEDTRIISFGSWRAWPRRAFIGEIHEINDSDICWHNEACFRLSIPMNATMLQAYNCDRQPPGQKTEVMPAEKQLYRSDHVLHHFVHYSAVTKLSVLNKEEWAEQVEKPWKPRAFPDPRQRFGSETEEALMLHTKAVAVQDTAGYKRMCHVNNLKKPVRRQGLCRLGVPWPKDEWPEDIANPPIKGTPEGFAYNCFVNEQIESILVPRLEAEMKRRAGPHIFDLPPPAEVAR